MRIIAGQFKQRQLVSPPDQTRPTSDRAREGLFSTVESSFNIVGDWDSTNIKVLDLFAGSGAVGIESYSRGATYVECVENNFEAASAIDRNISILKIETMKFKNIKMSVEKYLQNFRSNDEGFDFIYIDPPYKYENSEIESILSQIIQNNFLLIGGLIAVERNKKGAAFTWPSPLKLEKVKKYGQGCIYFGGNC